MDYYSPNVEDEAYGSSGNSYDKIWEGKGMFYIDEGEEGMDKAMRWAIGSASLSQKSTMIMAVLADQPGARYNCWVKHHTVQKIGRIGSSCCRKQVSMSNNGQLPSSNNARDKDLVLYVICNKKGREDVKDKDWNSMVSHMEREKLIRSSRNI